MPLCPCPSSCPWSASLALLPVANRDGRRDGYMRWVALACSLVTFARDARALVRASTRSAPSIQFVERVSWIPAFGIDYYLGIDGISLLLDRADRLPDAHRAALVLGLGASKKVKEFSIFMLLLETAMLGVFASLDLFLFYVFWDAMLIPMYFLIGVWGYDRRLYAAIKFLLFTMAGSVLMLDRHPVARR